MVRQSFCGNRRPISLRMTEQVKELDFRETLGKSQVCLHLESDTKPGIIKEMIRMLVDSGAVNDREAVEAAILERENKMSTGMQQGVALPHGKTDAVSELVTAVGLRKEGVDFGSLDGEPSNIFIMTVSRRDSTGPHIQFLAEVSKVLNNPALRGRILAAKSREEVLKVFTG